MPEPSTDAEKIAILSGELAEARAAVVVSSDDQRAAYNYRAVVNRFKLRWKPVGDFIQELVDAGLKHTKTNEAQARTIERLDKDFDCVRRDRDNETRRRKAVWQDSERFKEQRDEARQKYELLRNSRDHKDKTDAYVAGRQAARRDILAVFNFQGRYLSAWGRDAIDRAVPPEDKPKSPCTCSTWGGDCVRCKPSETSNCHSCGHPQTLMFAATLCAACHEKMKEPSKSPIVCPYCTVELETKPYLAAHVTICGLRPYPKG